MTLNCPSCKSRFMIDPAVLLPNGRKVRCGFCGERWFQEPLSESELEETAAAEAMEPFESAPDQAAESDSIGAGDAGKAGALGPRDASEGDQPRAETAEPDAMAQQAETTAAPESGAAEGPAEIPAESGAEEISTAAEDSLGGGALPGSGAGADLEEPWQDEAQAAPIEEGTEETEPERQDLYGKESDLRSESSYEAEPDESDWDSDWRGTQPLADESLPDEELEPEDRIAAEYGEAPAEPDLGTTGADAPSEAALEKAAEEAAQAAPAYDTAEALFEEPAESAPGGYPEEAAEPWDDLAKAAEPGESGAPEPAIPDRPAAALPAESPAETMQETAAEAAQMDEAEKSGPYGDGDEDQDGGRSVLADLGIEAGPEQGEGEGAAGDSWESALFAKKGTSRATILSPEGQGEEPEGPTEKEEAQGAESEDIEAQPLAAEPTGAEPTVYFDADEEPADEPQSYDPGRALEEVAEPADAGESVEPTVVVESKPVKTISDYLVAAVDDDEIENKEEDWGVSELESFFRDEEKRTDAPAVAAKAPEPAAPAEQDVTAVAPEAESEVLEASVSARAKFRRVMAAGATAAAAQEIVDETGEPDEEEAAAELAAAAQSKVSGGGSLARGWALYFATLLALGSVFYFGRGRLLDLEPRVAELYKLVGL